MSDLSARTATPDDRDALLDMMTDFNRIEGVAWTREGCAGPLATLLASAHLGVAGLLVEGDAVRGYFVLTWGYDLEWAGRTRS